MTVQVSNTELDNSFNTWRLSTNFMATIIGNNVVTVNPGGEADRGGYSEGNGHIEGTFSTTEFRTRTLHGGNTAVLGDLLISSNVSITGEDARELIIEANTTFSGNVDFDTLGRNSIVTMGPVGNIRLSGGS